MTRKVIKVGILPYREMKARTIAIARGRHKPSRDEPKVWSTSLDALESALSGQNPALLEAIGEHTQRRSRRRVRDQGVRIVQAPESQLASGVLPPNRVTSVTLRPGEDVVWTWTFTPNGGSYVSGYRIVKRKRLRRAR